MHFALKTKRRGETRRSTPNSRLLVPAIVAMSLAIAACEKKFTGDTAIFTCSDGVRVEVTYSQDRDRAMVRLEDKSYELTRTSAASGTKYSNGRVVFWNKGRGAIVEIDGRVAHDGCRLAE
jgi:membrane-bound inhibitor of C-type lysozyme